MGLFSKKNVGNHQPRAACAAPELVGERGSTPARHQERPRASRDPEAVWAAEDCSEPSLQGTDDLRVALDLCRTAALVGPIAPPSEGVAGDGPGGSSSRRVAMRPAALGEGASLRRAGGHADAMKCQRARRCDVAAARAKAACAIGQNRTRECCGRDLRASPPPRYLHVWFGSITGLVRQVPSCPLLPL
jgi:hypothetical protein